MSHLRTRLIALTCVAAAALCTTGAHSADAAAPAPAAAQLAASHPGLGRLLADGTPTGRAIVTFAAVPTAAQVSSLEALGLTVQPMTRLPLALVAGTPGQLAATVTSGIGRDVYPDERLDLLDTASTDAMSTSARVWKCHVRFNESDAPISS